MDKPKFSNVKPEVVEWMKIKNLSPKICDGCRKVILAVRDVSKPAYCDKCEPKKKLFERASSGVENIDQSTRDKISNSKVTRVGPFWSPKNG